VDGGTASRSRNFLSRFSGSREARAVQSRGGPTRELLLRVRGFLQHILCASNGILDPYFSLVVLALHDELGVAEGFSNGFLDCALGLLWLPNWRYLPARRATYRMRSRSFPVKSVPGFRISQILNCRCRQQAENKLKPPIQPPRAHPGKTAHVKACHPQIPDKFLRLYKHGRIVSSSRKEPHDFLRHCDNQERRQRVSIDCVEQKYATGTQHAPDLG